MLLLVVTPRLGNVIAQYSQYTKHIKGKTTTIQGYHRIYLLRDLKTDGLVCHMIKDCVQNSKWRKRNTALRDNGVVIIRICITILNAKLIKSYLADNILLVITMNSVIFLKPFNLYTTANIQSYIVKITTRAFCIEVVQLNMLSLSPVENDCSGHFFSR